ncbi:MAG: Na+-transporting NADH:ubiquinone oxidoreductase subunit F [Parasphingorhabdus sp.]|jgi:Na+-transporting NADH:ubiquinone oxidoreductase subunit F
MVEVVLGVVSFVAIVLLLSLMILGARRLLVPTGTCNVDINQQISRQVPVGQRLLETLDNSDIHLPTACGGAGTCGLCKVRVTKGGGEPLPQELALLSRAEIFKGTRLACQVPVLHAMEVEVEDVYFGVKNWQCHVLSIRNVTTLISEIQLQLPPGEKIDCRPGSFIQVTSPPYQLSFSQLDIDPRFKDIWNKAGIRSLNAGSTIATTRAYSMANKPGQKDMINLNVRIALPPPGSRNLPPGIVSSWLFSLQAGDMVNVSGPYGLFFVQDTDKEAIFIGGGVGMAPLYAQIRDLLEVQNSKRKLSFWYGARSGREVYYNDVFEKLQKDYTNFSWHLALSTPEPEDHWQGLTGFIHRLVLDEYLSDHSAPEDCEYYLCGPPLMIKAVRSMLDNLGVDSESIYFDDFGS